MRGYHGASVARESGQDMIGKTASIFLAATLTATTAMAQVRTVDPNNAGSMAATGPVQGQQAAPAPTMADDTPPPPPAQDPTSAPAPEQPAGTQPLPPASHAEIQAREKVQGGTYEQGDVVGAAEGVFGKGAAGLAGLIEKIFKEQGRPNAYIAGREALAKRWFQPLTHVSGSWRKRGYSGDFWPDQRKFSVHCGESACAVIMAAEQTKGGR